MLTITKIFTIVFLGLLFLLGKNDNFDFSLIRSVICDSEDLGEDSGDSDLEDSEDLGEDSEDLGEESGESIEGQD